VSGERAPQRSGERIDRSRPVVFSFNGGTIAGYAGDTIVSALSAAGVLAFGRGRRTQRPRGLLTADRFDHNTWLEVDDEPNVAAGHRLAANGMRVRSQHVWPALGLDLKALNQHVARRLRPSEGSAAQPGAAFLRPIYRELMRHLDVPGRARNRPNGGGLGHAHHTAVHLHPDVVVIGGGAAGLAAAAAAAEAGAETVVVEADHQTGGWIGLGSGRVVTDRLRDAAVAAGAVVLTGATVVGRSDDGAILAVLERVAGDELAIIRAGHVVAGFGLVERSATFAGNDLPAAMLATGARRLVNLWSVRPGQRAVVVGAGPQADLAVADLRSVGTEVVAWLDGSGPGLEAAHGSRHVETVVAGDGTAYEADLLVVAAGWTVDAALIHGLGGAVQVGGPGVRPSAAGIPGVISVVGALGGDGTVDDVIAQATVTGRQAAAAASRSTTAPARRRAVPPAPPLAAPEALPAVTRAGTGVVVFAEDVTSIELDGPGPVRAPHNLTVAAAAPGVDARARAELADLARVAELARTHVADAGALAAGVLLGTSGATTAYPAGIRLGSLAALHHRPLRRTTLTDDHERLGAVLEVCDGWLQPLDYGDSEDEETAVRERAGVRDTGASGLQIIDGEDAAAVVDAVLGLQPAPDSGEIVALRTAGYRHPLVVIGLDTGRFAIRTAAADTITLTDALATAFHLDHRGLGAVGEQIGEALPGIAVVGPDAAALVEAALGVRIPPGGVVELEPLGGWGWAAGTSATPVVEVRVAAGYAVSVWRALLHVGRTYRVRPVGWAALADAADLVDERQMAGLIRSPGER
jgi:sarcosine oxidase subunit alpha